jgi:hypothetical protein
MPYATRVKVLPAVSVHDKIFTLRKEQVSVAQTLLSVQSSYSIQPRRQECLRHQKKILPCTKACSIFLAQTIFFYHDFTLSALHNVYGITLGASIGEVAVVLVPRLKIGRVE